MPRMWCTDPKKIAEKGDILISVRAPIGAINIANEQCCIGRGVAAIRPNAELISKDFLRHQLCASRSKLEAMGTGSTFKAIGKKALNDLAIAIYPKREQETIAGQFNWVAEQTKVANSQLALLDSLVKSRFVEMFGDPVRSPAYPKQALGELAKVSSGATPSRKKPEYYKGAIPWVKTGEVATGTIFSTEEHITEEAIANSACHVFPEGTVLVAMYGQGDTRGKASILKIDAATNQACAALEFDEHVIPAFALAHLQLCYKDLRSLSHGGNQKNLSLQIIKGYNLVVPPLSLQQQFADFVAQVDKSRFVVLNEKISRIQLISRRIAHRYSR